MVRYELVESVATLTIVGVLGIVVSIVRGKGVFEETFPAISVEVTP